MRSKNENPTCLRSFFQIQKVVGDYSIILAAVIMDLLGMTYILFVSDTAIDKTYELMGVFSSFGYLSGLFAGMIMPLSYVGSYSLLTSMPIKNDHIPRVMAIEFNLIYILVFVKDIPLFILAGKPLCCLIDLAGICLMYIFSSLVMGMFISPGMRNDTSQFSPMWLLRIFSVFFVGGGFAVRVLGTRTAVAGVAKDMLILLCIADVILLAVSATVMCITVKRMGDKMFLRKVYSKKSSKKATEEDSYI